MSLREDRPKADAEAQRQHAESEARRVVNVVRTMRVNDKHDERAGTVVVFAYLDLSNDHGPRSKAVVAFLSELSRHIR